MSWLVSDLPLARNSSHLPYTLNQSVTGTPTVTYRASAAPLCAFSPARVAAYSARTVQLERSDDILRLVGIGQIDALTVVHAQLIVEQAVLVVRHRDQVTLDLDTLVTAAHVGFAEAVAHAGHLLDEEGIVAHAHIPRVHRVLEGEGALELAEFDGELLVLGPLHIEILHVRAGAIGLELNAILEIIEDAAVHVHTDQAAVEAGAAVGAFLVAVLIASDDVGAKLGLAHEIGHFVAVLGFLVLLRKSGETERGHERR